MTAKAEGIRQRSSDLNLASSIRHIIQITGGVRVDEVYRWWYYSVLDNHSTNHCLKGAGSADEVSGHRLGRAYWNLVSVVTKYRLYGDSLGLIV